MAENQREAEQPTEVPGGFQCDFCEKVVPRVRRVALDRDYERPQTRHQVRYACPECSEAKERDRAAEG